MATEFIDLPEAIIARIVSYLNQQDVCNVALTHFKLYQICQAKLYQRITIQYEPNMLGQPLTRENDYLDATQTVIHGFRMYQPKARNYELIKLRVEILQQSLTIHGALLDFIEEVSIFGEFDQANQSIRTLLQLLEGRSMKLFVGSSKLRKFWNKEIRAIKSNYMIVDKSIDSIPSHVTQLSFDLSRGFNHISIPNLVESIWVNGSAHDYWHWLHVCNQLQITSFTIMFNHGNEFLKVRELLETVSIDRLTALELKLGCLDKSCHQQCLGEFFSLLLQYEPFQLKKISVKQAFPYHTHKENEAFDLAIIDFLKSLNKFTKIQTLKISHSLPSDGNFEDGLEGNYLRRAKIYSVILPNVIEHIDNLILPNLMQTFACYEQQMNNVLYNGCRCDHCEKYLSLADDFIFKHKYYNFKLEMFRDLIPNQIVFALSDQLSHRLVEDLGLSPFDCLHYPLRSIRWDFHQNPLQVPFKCLETQVVDEGEFDHDEHFSDAHQIIDPCDFDAKFDFNRKFGTVVSHVLKDLMVAITGLYRGNAEDAKLEIGLVDGTGPLPFKKVLVNGIDFNLDKEKNGTNFFANVYDN